MRDEMKYTKKKGSYNVNCNFPLLISKLAAVCSPVCTPHSTINARMLNCRVRHVSGCIPAA